MGGQSDGELAALTAAETFRSACYRLTSKETFKDTFFAIQKQLNEAVCLIAQKSKIRLGSTSTLLGLNGKTAHLSHLGDSRCYLWRTGSLKQLSVDHIQVRPVANGGQKGRLTQYLGIFESELIIEPHNLTLSLLSEDVFILCSDGVSDVVSDQLLMQILKEFKDPRSIAEEMIRICLEQKAQDNCTVIIVRVSFPMVESNRMKWLK